MRTTYAYTIYTLNLIAKGFTAYHTVDAVLTAPTGLTAVGVGALGVGIFLAIGAVARELVELAR